MKGQSLTSEPTATAPRNPVGFLATQDLKERGWTPKLIARFLGDHDQTRPNGLKMGRRRLPPVKLYLEARVETAEQDEAFLLAQHRALETRERLQAAKAERQARRMALLESAAERYRPQVAAQTLRKGAVNKARAPYLQSLEQLLSELKSSFAASAAPESSLQPTSKRLKASQNKLPKKAQPLSEAEEKALRAALMRRLDQALAVAYAWFPDPDAAVAKPADRRASKSAPQAQPADWRSWDWDE